LESKLISLQIGNLTLEYIVRPFKSKYEF